MTTSGATRHRCHPASDQPFEANGAATPASAEWCSHRSPVMRRPAQLSVADHDEDHGTRVKTMSGTSFALMSPHDYTAKGLTRQGLGGSRENVR
jgi:hypothetical protein